MSKEVSDPHNDRGITAMSTRLPTYFISHGGGPWPWMKELLGDVYAPLESFLQGLPQQLPTKPKGILVITGHWETPELRVSSTEHPGMIYDYSNFPPHTYQIEYPAPGDPALARAIKEQLQAAGIIAKEDSECGFDHGTFVPLAKPLRRPMASKKSTSTRRKNHVPQPSERGHTPP
ncbi:MAG TPA: class III extradiol ring-cleavage dioxygenase [Cellvibrionaceae bacterium]